MRVVTGLLLILLGSACKTSGAKPSAQVLAAGGPRFAQIPPDEDAVRPTADERRALVARSLAYGPDPRSDRGSRSLLEGPQQVQFKRGKLDRQKWKEFPFDAALSCDFLPAWRDDKPGGKTPKFFCSYQYGKEGDIKTKKLKVKYDDPASPSVNTGVYGEVLATRLLWTLGYPTDTVLPVQVRCKGCPADPWRQITSYWAVQELEAELPPAGSAVGTVAEVSTESGGAAGTAPGAAASEQQLLDHYVRLVASVLSGYTAFADVRIERAKPHQSVVTAAGATVFSTTDGVLKLSPAHAVKIYDPATRRLLRDETAGYSDFVLASLPFAAAGHTQVTRDYTSAIVEWKHASIPVETYYHEGWSFNTTTRDPGREADIRNVDASHPEVARQRQELALLSAFIAHADNKAEQQRLICLDADKVEAEDDDCAAASKDPRRKDCQPGTDKVFTTCDKPMLMLQDLGFAMGFGAKSTGVDKNGRTEFDSTPLGKAYGTADAAGFLAAPIFKDEAACVTTVNEWATGVEIEEPIGEAARAALVAKLTALADNDQDLTDLFHAARLHLRALHLAGQPMPAWGSAPAGGGVGAAEKAIVDEFKAAFRAKVAKLAAMRCPAR